MPMSHSANKPLPVKFGTISFEDSKFTDTNKVYLATSLARHAEDLRVFELPLMGLDLSRMPWSSSMNNIKDFAGHMKRVMKADLKYPIILDDEGYIADGWHRVAKALLEDKPTIKAVRFDTNPPCDYTIDAE